MSPVRWRGWDGSRRPLAISPGSWLGGKSIVFRSLPLWARPADELQGTCQFEVIGATEPCYLYRTSKRVPLHSKGTAPWTCRVTSPRPQLGLGDSSDCDPNTCMEPLPRARHCWAPRAHPRFTLTASLSPYRGKLRFARAENHSAPTRSQRVYLSPKQIGGDPSAPERRRAHPELLPGWLWGRGVPSARLASQALEPLPHCWRGDSVFSLQN